MSNISGAYPQLGGGAVHSSRAVREEQRGHSAPLFGAGDGAQVGMVFHTIQRILRCLFSVFWIRIDLNTDPDPAFQANTDPALDSDPGFFMTQM